MKLIAHRGNIDGPNPLEENKPEYIDFALNLNYDVEVDLRFIDDRFYLGHDYPQYEVSIPWLLERKDNVWIHCKDLKSLSKFSSMSDNFNYFWHQNDDFTLTSKRYIWTYPGKEYTYMSIIVLPESYIDIDKFIEIRNYKCFGVCTDYVNNINILN